MAKAEGIESMEEKVEKVVDAFLAKNEEGFESLNGTQDYMNQILAEEFGSEIADSFDYTAHLSWDDSLQFNLPGNPLLTYQYEEIESELSGSKKSLVHIFGIDRELFVKELTSIIDMQCVPHV